MYNTCTCTLHVSGFDIKLMSLFQNTPKAVINEILYSIFNIIKGFQNIEWG